MGESSQAVFRTARRVEFRDTDMAGIAHFSVFFLFMEEVEHEFLRHLGMGVIWNTGEHQISWPRVAASCNFRRPLRFEQSVEIALQIVRLGESSVTYGFQFTSDGEVVADGQVTAVCCEFPHDRPPASIPIPEVIRRCLAPYLTTDPQG